MYTYFVFLVLYKQTNFEIFSTVDLMIENEYKVCARNYVDFKLRIVNMIITDLAKQNISTDDIHFEIQNISFLGQ